MACVEDDLVKQVVGRVQKTLSWEVGDGWSLIL